MQDGELKIVDIQPNDIVDSEYNEGGLKLDLHGGVLLMHNILRRAKRIFLLIFFIFFANCSSFLIGNNFRRNMRTIARHFETMTIQNPGVLSFLRTIDIWLELVHAHHDTEEEVVSLNQQRPSFFLAILIQRMMLCTLVVSDYEGEDWSRLQ